MSTVVKVDAKTLLNLPSVQLIPEFAGTIQDALNELNERKPNADWVTELLRPCLFIRLPGAPSRVNVEIRDNLVWFDCSDVYLRFLMGFCEAMAIQYDLVK